jgi:Fe-S cluster biogenesis protein NfuA
MIQETAGLAREKRFPVVSRFWDRAMMSKPNSPSEADRRELLERIESVLDREIRAGLLPDGGDVEVVGIDDDRIVQVRFKGTCQGCPSTIMTLTMGIEAAVKAEIPEIRFLEAIP